VTTTTRADSAGRYRFSALHEGTYIVRAEMAEYGEATAGPVVLGMNEEKTIDLTPASAITSATQSTSSSVPQFFDQPTFTVAGVADATNLGGHGSDAIVRNRNALAKATASLSQDPADDKNLVVSIDAHGIDAHGEDARAKLQAMLAVKQTAELHHSLADVEEKLGDPLEAVQEYQRAAEMNPSEPNLFDWGSDLLTHRAAEPAIEVFAKGTSLFPSSVRMLIGLGVAYYASGSYEKAAQRLYQASDLDPSDPNPYVFLGRMQSIETAQPEGLTEKLARFVRLQPDNALANYYYAVSLWKRRGNAEDATDLPQVESSLEKTVRLDPQLGVGYLQLGVVYAERKDFPRAISAYQQAIKVSPRLEEAHYRLAQAYRQTGEKLKARQEFELYEQISKETAGDVERERHEIPQFVYRLRDKTSGSPPQSQ